MFDELEIACWVKFVDKARVCDLLGVQFDPQSQLNQFFDYVHKIAVTTKFLLTTDTAMKDRIMAKMISIIPGFATTFQHFNCHYSSHFAVESEGSRLTH
jgi:hypothetical protein